MGSDREYNGAALVDLNPSWPIMTLENICDGIFDCPHSTPKLSDEGYYMVRTQDIRKGFYNTEDSVKISMESYLQRTKRAKPQHGDILLSREGTYFGDAAEVPNDTHLCLGQRMVLLRPCQKRINPIFLRIWINSKNFQNYLLAFRDGTVAERLNLSTIRKLPIPVPSLDVQVQVISLITPLEKKEMLNRQMSVTLEGMAQVLFKSWFVDFDPVLDNAIRAGNPIPDELAERAEVRRSILEQNQNDELGMLNTEKSNSKFITHHSSFPSAFQLTEEMGWIPEGWNVTNIGSIASVIKGKSYKSSELKDSKTALVTLKSFKRGGGYRLDGLKEYVGKYKPEQEVTSGDLIIAYTDVTQTADVIGKPAMIIANSKYDTLVVSLDVAVVRPSSECFKYYLYGLTKTMLFQDHTASHSTGTTVLHLGKDAVPGYKFTHPQEYLLREYQSIAQSIFTEIVNRTEQNNVLANFSDTLLPKLISGELSIPKAEKLTEDILK